MRLTKTFGFIAMIASMAIAMGTSGASAAGVVLCKELVTTCPAGQQWPSGTVILGLASAVEFDGSLTVKCEDSTLSAKTSAASGSPLPLQITSLEFGKLPTPSLGEGCTTCLQIHVGIPINGSIEVEATDKYFLSMTGRLQFLKCTFLKVSCEFEGKILEPIFHTGQHPLHKGTNLSMIDIDQSVELVSGSEFFCGELGNFLAKYILHLAHSGGQSGLVWPALS